MAAAVTVVGGAAKAARLERRAPRVQQRLRVPTHYLEMKARNKERKRGSGTEAERHLRECLLGICVCIGWLVCLCALS